MSSDVMTTVFLSDISWKRQNTKTYIILCERVELCDDMIIISSSSNATK